MYNHIHRILMYNQLIVLLEMFNHILLMFNQLNIQLMNLINNQEYKHTALDNQLNKHMLVKIQQVVIINQKYQQTHYKMMIYLIQLHMKLILKVDK